VHGAIPLKGRLDATRKQYELRHGPRRELECIHDPKPPVSPAGENIELNPTLVTHMKSKRAEVETNYESTYKTMKQYPESNSCAAFLTRTAMALLWFWASAGPLAGVEIISVKFTSPKNSNQNWMYAGDYAGAPAVRTNNWNNLLATADGNSSPITLAAGTVSNSAGAILPNFWVYAHPTTSAGGGGVFNRVNGTTNDGKMFGDVTDTYQCNSFANYGYIDFTNVPYSQYSIYCYFRDDNGNGSANARGGFFCITNTSTGTNRFYIKNQSNDVSFTQVPVPSNTGSGYLPSSVSTIPAGGSTWAGSGVAGGNYVVFNNLTNSWTRVWFGGLGNGTGGKDDLGNYITDGSTAVRFKVAGFQIVQIPPALPIGPYLQDTNLILHAGNPAGKQLVVLADLNDGVTKGIDETANCTFSVDNTNVATVTSGGVVTPGTNGTATLTIALPSATVYTTTNYPISVIGPTSLSISVANTNLLVGNGQGDGTVATLYANYSDASNIVVNAYNYVSFSSSGAVTVMSNRIPQYGIIKATNTGAFSVTGTYDGLSVTANNVGRVTYWSAPGTVRTFSVNLTDSTNNVFAGLSPNDGMTFHDLSGITGARVGYWNNVVMTFGNVTNEIDNPMDYQGNILTNVVVQVLPNGTVQEVLTAAGTRTTNESIMFNTYFDQGAGNGTSANSYIVISNVPYATYDAYFYFYNDNSNLGTNRPGQVTIDSVTQYRINSMAYASIPDNSGNGYAQAVQPLSPPTSVTQVPYGNFIKFSSLTDAVLNVTWGAVGQDVFLDAASTTRVRLAGFQIVEFPCGTVTNMYLQSPVPNQLPGNPATYNVTVLADFTCGSKGYPITPFCTFSSSDTNIFGVDANGSITPGLTPGTAALTVSYQTNSLLAGVTNLAPIAVRVAAAPGTVYLDGSLYNLYGLISAQASAYADFPGADNVNISGFNSVSFVDQGSPVCSMAANGAITPNPVEGSANLGVSYLGTTYVTANAFTVRSITSAPVLAHLYSFTNAANSTVVVDTIGGANGTVYGPLGGNQPITFDGSHVIFPGDAGYTNEPYISLRPGLINQMGDVTIEMWGGQSQLRAWARFLSFGSTAKGLDPRNYGAEISILELLASYVGTGHATFFTPFHLGDVQASYALTNGAEYHMVVVYAPNAGTNAFYINGVLIGGGTPTNAPLNISVNDTVDWLGVSLANDDPPLAGWMNMLAIYEGELSASQVYSNYTNGVPKYLPPLPVSTEPTNIVWSLSNNVLTLSWPADHLGWKLQMQTNSAGEGLSTNWVTLPGSDAVTSTNITINPAIGSVFYRMSLH